MKLIEFLFFLLINLSQENKLKKVKSQYKNDTLLFQKNELSADYYSYYKTSYYEIIQSECTPISCPPITSFCSTNSLCKCNKGYLTNPNSSTQQVCSYKLKSQLITFILEVSTFIGGDIYLGYYSYAAIKAIIVGLQFLIYSLNIPCYICGIRDLINHDCFPCLMIKTGSIVICGFTIITWLITDLINIISNDMTDSSKMPLLYFF